jgi:oligoribonuclease
MNEWCVKQHNASGLVSRVKNSQITEVQAEEMTLAFLKQYADVGCAPMCGNSIHQDRRFLYEYMPSLARFFHYRHLDVSTLKVLNLCWEIAPKFEKDSTHLAMDDIKASIEELKFYRKSLLREL